MGRPVVIEVGVGILAAAAIAYFYPSPLAAILLGLGGMLVLAYGFAPGRGDEHA